MLTQYFTEVDELLWFAEVHSEPLNFCCSYYTDCVWPLKQANTYFIHSSHSTDNSMQDYAIYTTQCIARYDATGQNKLRCTVYRNIVTACHRYRCKYTRF